jgi:hypothetical protein
MREPLLVAIEGELLIDTMSAGQGVHNAQDLPQPRRRGRDGVEELAAIVGHEPNSIPVLLRSYYRPSDRPAGMLGETLGTTHGGASKWAPQAMEGVGADTRI